MKKYNNIPSYMKNVKRSGKNIMSNQLRGLMPILSDTVVSGKDAFREFSAFDKSNGIQYGNYVKQRKNIIFGPLRDFIRNAKEDLKSGKYYNEERISGTFGNGIDEMLDGFGDIDEISDDNELEDVRITSKFDRYLKSTSNSLSIGNKTLSNSLNEVNINNTEYIANVNTMNSTKFMALTTKNHMEQMKQLKNIENIGMSMLKFNQDIVASAIERQDKFHDDILNETRELKELIQQQTDFNMSRFKSGSKSSNSYSPLNNILGNTGSGLNIREYVNNVKKNLKRQSPMDKDMISTVFKSYSGSPISTILNFLIPTLIPKNIKKGMEDLDKGIGALFATYLLQLNNIKYNGKKSMARTLAEILGVNINTYSKPNLSIYRNQDMTLEIEQKKAKAITEVIPTYLSKITEAMTGITKSYDYTRGVFVDKTKKRKEVINDYKNNIYNDMYNSGRSLEKQYELQRNNLSKNQSKYIEHDLREFIIFLGSHTIQYNPSMTYSQLRRKGLRLKGGETSYNLIRRFYASMSKTEQMNVRNEQLQSLAGRPDLNSRFDIDLQSSGDSALFNGMDEFDEDGNLVTVSYAGMRGRINGRNKYNIRRDFKKRKKKKNKDEKSWTEIKLDEYNSKVNDGVVKVLNKLGIKTSPIVGLLAGLTDSIYGLSNGTGKATDKATDFMTTILNSLKTTIFGEYDDSGNAKKEGILPKKIGDQIKKYLPRTSAGATIGGLFGLTMKHPLLGAVAGGALNVLIETDKVKKFLWGDPDKDDDKGIFGGLKDKLDKKIIDPLREFLKEKFKDKMGDAKDKVDSFFDTYDTMSTTNSKKYKIKSGSIEDILKPIGKSNSSGSSHLGIINKITGELERGIYSSQLDTIISLLSGGFGYADQNGRISPPNNRGGRNNKNKYSPIVLTEKDYKVIGKNIIDSATGRSDGSVINLGTGSLMLEADNRAVSRERRVRKNRLRNDSKYKSINPIRLEKAIDILEDEQVEDGLVPLTDNEIYERAIVDELKKNPSFAKQVKDVANQMLPHFKDKIEFIRKGARGKHNSSEGDTILGSALGKIKSKTGEIDFSSIKSKLSDKLALRGIGRGRGGLIGMALGSMVLGNPILGAIAGMTFTGKSDRQKQLEKEMGGSQFKPGRTAAKYGLLTTLLGLGPMPGILLGALMPQKKKDPDREPTVFDKMFAGSSKKGRFIGGLTGLAFGGLPGMLIGGALGGKLIGKNKNKEEGDRKYTKDDWDVRNEIVYDPVTGNVTTRKRTKKEIKEYLTRKKDEQTESKRRKVARGTVMDIITGGGKLRGGAVGGLAGLMVGGIPGLLLGGLGGTVLGTKRRNLDRDKTAGILNKQGKWKASIIGALIGNALMGPIVGPLVGGLMGSMLAKGTDKKFWRYDENGKVLSKSQQKAQKQAFKKEYKYKRDTELYNYDMWLYNRAVFNTQRDLGTIGPPPDINDPKYDSNEKRGFWEARRKRREIMDRENAIRDENAKKFNKGDRKFNLDNLAVFNQSKVTGAFKGAAIATQFLGPYAGIAGAALGALTSKKRTPPDGSSKKPFYVRNVADEPKTKDNPHGYDKKRENDFNRQNKKNLEDIKNADTKNGDIGAEKQLKEVVDDIQKSSMNTKHKKQSMEDVTQYTSALKTSSSNLVGGNGDNQDSGGGLLDTMLSLFGLGAGRGIGSLILKFLKGAALPAIGTLIGYLLKGDDGHGNTNDYGDLEHANIGDRIIYGSGRLGSKTLGKWVSNAFGLGKAGNFSASQIGNGLIASQFYSNEADAYSDQGDVTNAQEAQYGALTNSAKSKWYAVDTASRLIRSKAGTNIFGGISNFATNRSLKAAVKGNTRSANIWSNIANRTNNIYNTAQNYKGFKGRYNVIRSGFSNAGNSIMTWARNKVASEGVETAASTATAIATHVDDAAKVTNGVGRFINKLFGEGKISKLLNKTGAKVSGVAKKITNWVSTKLAKQLVKSAGTVLAKVLGKVAQIVSVVLAWLPLATAVVAFINGWNNVNNELQLSNDYSPEWWERLTCGLVYALDDFLCGAIDLFGLRDDLINLLIGFFGGKDKLEEIQKSQMKASSEYEKFLQENDLSREAFTMEQYQNATNKTIWGHVKSFFGAGDDLDDYKKGSEKNNELREKYGGYEAGQQSLEETDITDGYSSQSGGSSTTNDILLSILDAINGLAGGAYVVQNNQKTVNISGGSYDSSINAANDAMNAMSGGRGSSDNFKNMVPRNIFKKTTGRNNIPQISKNALRRYNAGSGRGVTVNKFNKKLTKGFGRYSGRGGNGDQVVQTAMQFLGQPYVWGGSNPSEGFDCSGLLQYSLSQNGINISRTTYDQVNEGTAVSKSDLQPGDAVFFGTANDVHHVGIYIGNGEYLHAPKTGDVIKISKLSDRSDYYTARRYTTPGTGNYSSSNSSSDSSSSNASNSISSSSSRNLYNSNVTKGKMLLQSKARKPVVTSISSNSTPEETVLSVTNNEDVQNILQTAYENDENFMNESNIADNKNIKKKDTTKEQTSESFATKVLKGLKSAGGKVLNSGKNLLKKGANVVVRAAKWAWDKVKKGANWVGDKISGAWNWITGGRGRGEETIQDPDYYNQQDPRWSNMSFGRYNNHRDTVGDGGCGPTTAATVIQKMTGQTITPAEASKFALNNGYKIDDGGTTPDYFNALGSKYGVNFNQSDPYSSETISSLQHGKPVIFLGHDSTGTSPFGSDSHYVVGTGMDRNGNISILDPKNRLNNRVYNITDIAYNAYKSIVPNKTGGRGKYSGRGIGYRRNNVNISGRSGRLVGKLSSILDALTPKNNILDTILNTMYSAYDGDDDNNTNTATSSTNNTSDDISINGITKDTFINTDIYNLPKLSEDQIYQILNNKFKNATWEGRSSIFANMDLKQVASDIYRAQNDTGISALLGLSIGAHESAYGASYLANLKGNLWGYGATNKNTTENAYSFGSNQYDAFVGYYNNLVNDYYNGYGAKTIYQMGSGDNPGGAGYAYDDDGTINPGWIDSVWSMAQTLLAASGGRGISSNKYLTNKLNKPSFKNPFRGKNKLTNTYNLSNNKSYSSKPSPRGSIHPIVSRYSTFDPIVKPKTNYGGRGFTPIPTTASVIDALSLKGTNSIVKTVDDVIQRPSSSYNNVNTNTSSPSIDSSKLDEGNQISSAILTVLKGIAVTLERIERNSALSSGNNFNAIAYGENGELAAQSYKAVMMNNIIAGN